MQLLNIALVLISGPSIKVYRAVLAMSILQLAKLWIGTTLMRVAQPGKPLAAMQPNTAACAGQCQGHKVSLFTWKKESVFKLFHIDMSVGPSKRKRSIFSEFIRILLILLWTFFYNPLVVLIYFLNDLSKLSLWTRKIV